MSRTQFYYLSIWVFPFILCACQQAPQGFQFDMDIAHPSIQYGIGQLQSEEAYHLSQMTISGDIDTIGMENEAFSISVNNQEIKITAGDETGMMYALLDIKHQLQFGNGAIEERKEKPNLTFRAIKYNLPWDSYRNSEALDLHYETCRDTTYWEAFLDMMASNRFNVLTLWNLHPFNYLVKTSKYPEASAFSDEEMAEWEAFWHSLFRMAKVRGIETYLVNWNIFVSPEFAKAHGVAAYCIDNEYITDSGDTSEIIRDYTREVVREVIDTYPDLTGLGITLGEGMGGMTAKEREQWLLDSYIEGMRQASRKVKFIHRVPLSANKGSGGSTSFAVEKMTRQTLDTLSCVEGPMTIELKFNWSHAYSSPHLVKVHGGKLSDAYWNPIPENYRLSWMMRNEDFFMLRWGQPDFIRQHIDLNTPEYVQGYFVGSECYIPAKDYFTKLPGASYRYAFERQWMYYQMWGRLLYNPETPDTLFEQSFYNRFPNSGDVLFSAQRKVSKVPLIIASYMNATWDFTLYSEGMMELRDGKMQLISIDRLGQVQPLEPAYVGITEFVSPDYQDDITTIDPIQLSDSLEFICQTALDEILVIDPESHTDLLYEVSDIKIWAHLGLYFSLKLKAAVYHEKQNLEKVLQYLERSQEVWKQLVEITTPVYDPVPLVHYNRSDREKFHWSNWEADIAREIQELLGK